MTDQPAWGWKVVVIAISLMLPAMLLGSVLAIGVGWLILGQTPTQVQIAIPGQFAAYSLWLKENSGGAPKVVESLSRRRS